MILTCNVNTLKLYFLSVGNDLTQVLIDLAVAPAGCGGGGLPDDQKFPFDPDFDPPVSH